MTPEQMANQFAEHGMGTLDVVRSGLRLAWLEGYRAAQSAVLDADAREFPESREVGRVGDMAPPDKTHMRIVLDCDNDVCIEVWDDEHGDMSRATIEFCTSYGGGKSPKTRAALIAVMVAMEADNIECPRGAFPALAANPPATVKER